MSHEKIDFLLLAVSGKHSCGKDEAGTYLADHYGMEHVTSSDFLRQEAAAQGFKPPFARELLGNIGDGLRKQYGSAPISRKLCEQYQSHQNDFPGGLAICGLSRVHEVENVHNSGGIVIFVDAPDNLRYDWLVRRSRDDHISLQKFKEREAAEVNGTTPEGREGLWINGVRDRADIVIVNDGSLDGFHQKIDEVMQSLPERAS